MSPLEKLQQTLFAAIATDAPVDDAHMSTLVHAGALSARERVELYADMYWLRMRDTLSADFALTRRLLGEQAFETAVAKYIQRWPSTHYSLGARGGQFANFLQSLEVPAVAPPLAALEWARVQAFVARDAEALTMAQVAPELQARFAEARLVLHPSVAMVSSAYDLGPLFTALQAEAPVGEELLARRDTQWLVWRRGFSVFHVSVSHAEAKALTLALDGASLPALCECFGDDEGAAAQAFQAIGSWVTEGLVTAVQ